MCAFIAGKGEQMKELRSNADWAGEFQTMAERMMYCASEEQMYKTLRMFKEDIFTPEYGRLSRTKRRKRGCRWKDGFETDEDAERETNGENLSE